MWEDFDYIATDKCDSCGRRSVGVMLHCRGTPVMFLCARPMCGGHLAFERTARADIDAWLNTKEPDNTRRNEQIDRDVECLMFELGLTGQEAA